MGKKTAIGWTNATWNPVRGCSRISPGCGGPNGYGGCYAEKIAARFSDPSQPFHGFATHTPSGGRWTGKLALVDKHLEDPIHWKTPMRIFVNSMSDLFHENLPDFAIDQVFAVMARAPQHIFQILTKRDDRMREYMTGESLHHSEARQADAHERVRSWVAQSDDWTNPRGDEDIPWPLPNVWLGVSVEDQYTADKRIPNLVVTPAALHFLSCEPLLEPVDLSNWLWNFIPCPNCPCKDPSVDRTGYDDCCKDPEIGAPLLQWVIGGLESGPKRRDPGLVCIEDLRKQCADAGTAFYFKQDSHLRAGQRGRASDDLWACKQYPEAKP